MPAILSSVVWAISPTSDVAEFAPFMADSLVPMASLNCKTRSRQQKLGLCKKIEGVLETRQVLVTSNRAAKNSRIWKSQKAK